MKKLITFLTIIILVVTITGCTTTKEKSDALKFKEEYESLNGKKNDHGKKNRSVTIPEDNPIKYATANDIVEMMDNKESFIVYFGFNSCPWCRSMVEEMFKVAKETEVDTIYYVDVLDIRDVKELDENGNIKTTKEGTKGYLKLIKKLDNVLSDYKLTNDNEEEVEVGEKRIYAPNVVAIENGKATKLEEGISEDLEDPYSELTDKMKEDSYNSLKCVFECLEAKVCKKNAC